MGCDKAKWQGLIVCQHVDVRRPNCKLVSPNGTHCVRIVYAHFACQACRFCTRNTAFARCFLHLAFHFCTVNVDWRPFCCCSSNFEGACPSFWAHYCTTCGTLPLCHIWTCLVVFRNCKLNLIFDLQVVSELHYKGYQAGEKIKDTDIQAWADWEHHFFDVDEALRRST